jgi:hypothetical protein
MRQGQRVRRGTDGSLASKFSFSDSNANTKLHVMILNSVCTYTYTFQINTFTLTESHHRQSIVGTWETNRLFALLDEQLTRYLTNFSHTYFLDFVSVVSTHLLVCATRFLASRQIPLPSMSALRTDPDTGRKVLHIDDIEPFTSSEIQVRFLQQSDLWRVCVLLSASYLAFVSFTECFRRIFEASVEQASWYSGSYVCHCNRRLFSSPHADEP